MAETPPDLIGKRRHAVPETGMGAVLWTCLVLFIVITACLPLVSLVWQATGESGGVWPHLFVNVLPSSTATTVILLAGVGLGTVVIGSGTAWLVSRYQFPLRDLLQWSLILPLAIPTYVAAYTWGEFADYTGPLQTALRSAFDFETSRDYWFPDIRSTGGAIFLLSLVLFPYVYLPARLAFRQQAATLIDSARVLGAGPWRVFVSVAMPAARPAIAVGAILALMETLNDIGAVEFLGVRTLTFSVFDTWLNRSSLAGAAQLSIVLLGVVLVLMAAEKRLRGGQRFDSSRQQTKPPELITLGGAKAIAAMGACTLPVILGFIIPVFQMVRFTLNRPGQITESGLLSAAFASLEVATLTALACVLAGFVLVYARRRSPKRMFRSAAGLAGMGYAVPGTILALGVLTMMTGIDRQISQIGEAVLGIKTGLIFSGSVIVIVFACSVRFLTISMGNIEAGYSRISPNMAMAARTLGRNERQTLLTIELPLMLRALGVAGLLVFVETMKELSATILLRPFNYETLATFVYSYASRALFEDAAFAALLIVLFGLIPVYVLTRVVISGQTR